MTPSKIKAEPPHLLIIERLEMCYKGVRISGDSKRMRLHISDRLRNINIGGGTVTDTVRGFWIDETGFSIG